MEKEDLANFWPILYFMADWPAESYPFDLNVRVVKATEEILAVVGNTELYAWGANNKAMCDFYQDTERFFSLPQTPLERIEKLEQLRAIENGCSILVGKVKHTCDGIDTPGQYAEFVKRYKGK